MRLPPAYLTNSTSHLIPSCHCPSRSLIFRKSGMNVPWELGRWGQGAGRQGVLFWCHSELCGDLSCCLWWELEQWHQCLDNKDSFCIMPNLGHILGPPIVSSLVVVWWWIQHAGRGTVALGLCCCVAWLQNLSSPNSSSSSFGGSEACCMQTRGRGLFPAKHFQSLWGLWRRPLPKRSGPPVWITEF